MNSKLLFLSLTVAILIPLTLAACATDAADEDSVADSVAQTLTAAPLTTLPTDQAEDAQETFQGDLQPLSPEECEQLAAYMVNRLPVPPVEQDIVAVAREGEAGGGCRAIAVGTGEVFPDMLVVEEAMLGILLELGWTEDSTAPTCLGTGGWGPGASSTCFTQADAFCELFVHMDPDNHELCSEDEPIGVCFDRLAPEQILYTIELTCARDASPEARPLNSELMRIEFEPGASQVLIYGEAVSGGLARYVLTAMEGQTMTINLRDRNFAIIDVDTAVLIVSLADGTVLFPDPPDSPSWSGYIPSTQDYYIDILSFNGEPLPYTLEIIIPPT